MRPSGPGAGIACAPTTRREYDMFKSNEAPWDRGVRALLGVVLIALLLTTEMFTGGLAIAGWIIASVMLVTAATGFCGLYAVLGVQTCDR